MNVADSAGPPSPELALQLPHVPANTPAAPPEMLRTTHDAISAMYSVEVGAL